MNEHDKYEKFYDEMLEYLSVKFPKESREHLMEAASFIVNKSIIMVADAYRYAHEYYTKSIQSRKYFPVRERRGFETRKNEED